MQVVSGFLAVAALLSFSACSNHKVRLDCYDECKRKGYTFSGVISRDSRVDDQGQIEVKEVCRCNLEKSIL